MAHATLDIQAVSIDKVHPNTWNPNVQDERTFEATKESLDHFGYIAPVIVRPHPTREGEFEIVDGEHRWRALTEQGHDGTIDVVVGAFTDQQAKRLTVILNETRGSADKVELAKLFDSLDMDAADLIIGLPYTDEELDGLLKLADFDFDHFAGGSGQGEAPDPDDQWASIHVRVPMAVMPLWEDARQRAEKIAEGEPHGNVAVRNGLALEVIIADWMNSA